MARPQEDCLVAWGLEKGHRHRKRGLAFQSLLQPHPPRKGSECGPHFCVHLLRAAPPEH